MSKLSEQFKEETGIDIYTYFPDVQELNKANAKYMNWLEAKNKELRDRVIELEKLTESLANNGIFPIVKNT
tara:strand:- start:1236 stop:1448 length:213 start_codon:yes stop_codon:yes gene_type:complete